VDGHFPFTSRTFRACSPFCRPLWKRCMEKTPGSTLKSSTVWNPKNSQYMGKLRHDVIQFHSTLSPGLLPSHAEHMLSIRGQAKASGLGFILNRSRFGSTLIQLAMWILRTAVPYMYCTTPGFTVAGMVYFDHIIEPDPSLYWPGH
jgi:hypothetical protein